MKRRADIRGFTLIELLVVVSIMGMLASVVLASISVARTRAFDSKYFSEIRQLKLAMELYKSTYNEYPISLVNPVHDYNMTLGWDTQAYTDFNVSVNPAISTNLDTYLAVLVSSGYIPKIPHYNGWISGITNRTSPQTWLTYIKNGKTNSNGLNVYSCSTVTDPSTVLGKTMILIGYVGIARGFNANNYSNTIYRCQSNGATGCTSSASSATDPQITAPGGSSIICMPLD